MRYGTCRTGTSGGITLSREGNSARVVGGVYGLQTAAAVHAFQIDRKMLVDGEVGAGTAKALKIGWYQPDRHASWARARLR
jgi:peptidoglycan hydrolase-like protein with peptidoglycan-binding domain